MSKSATGEGRAGCTQYTVPRLVPYWLGQPATIEATKIVIYGSC